MGWPCAVVCATVTVRLGSAGAVIPPWEGDAAFCPGAVGIVGAVCPGNGVSGAVVLSGTDKVIICPDGKTREVTFACSGMIITGGAPRPCPGSGCADCVDAPGREREDGSAARTTLTKLEINPVDAGICDDGDGVAPGALLMAG